MERLTVPPTLDSLEPIGKFVVAAAQAAGLDRKAAYRLRLAVDELATNVITYGYQESGLTGVVNLCADIDDERLMVSIEDTAVPYDPTKAGVPESIDYPLEDRPIGGLGVYLAQRAVDELRYERVDGRNRSILIVKRPAAVPETEQQGD